MAIEHDVGGKRSTINPRLRFRVDRFAELVLILRDSARELLQPGIVEQLAPPERELAKGVIEACQRFDAAREAWAATRNDPGGEG